MPAWVQFTEVCVFPIVYRQLAIGKNSWPLCDHPSKLEFASEQGGSMLYPLAVSVTVVWFSLWLTCLWGLWASVWMLWCLTQCGPAWVFSRQVLVPDRQTPLHLLDISWHSQKSWRLSLTNFASSVTLRHVLRVFLSPSPTTQVFVVLFWREEVSI